MQPLRGQNQASPKEKAIRAAKARKKKSIDRLYREYVPPQIKEMRRNARLTGTAFIPWTRSTQRECACGKTFGSLRWLKKHQQERGCGR